MNTKTKIKSKNSTLSKVVSDQTLHKPKKNVLVSSRSDGITSRDSKHGLTLQDSKLIHHINIQIPSTNSPNLSSSVTKKKVKKIATLKGYTSKLSVKSPKGLGKPKKSLKEGNKDALIDFHEKFERNSVEKIGKKTKLVENELKKALDENRKLKKILNEEKQNEEVMDEIMVCFKSRLYKFLYE